MFRGKLPKNLLGIMSCGVAMLCFSPSSRAAGLFNGQAFVGGQLGASSISHDVGTGIGFGLEAGYFFNSLAGLNNVLGLGGLLRYSNHQNSYSSFVVAGEGLAKLDMLLAGLEAGLLAGSGTLNYNNPTTGVTATGTSFIWGLKGALDIPVSAAYPVTVGVDVSLMFFTPGSAPNSPGLTAFTPMLTGKWHF